MSPTTEIIAALVWMGAIIAVAVATEVVFYADQVEGNKYSKLVVLSSYRWAAVPFSIGVIFIGHFLATFGQQGARGGLFVCIGVGVMLLAVDAMQNHALVRGVHPMVHAALGAITGAVFWPMPPKALGVM